MQKSQVSVLWLLFTLWRLPLGHKTDSNSASTRIILLPYFFFHLLKGWKNAEKSDLPCVLIVRLSDHICNECHNSICFCNLAVDNTVIRVISQVCKLSPVFATSSLTRANLIQTHSASVGVIIFIMLKASASKTASVGCNPGVHPLIQTINALSKL